MDDKVQFVIEAVYAIAHAIQVTNGVLLVCLIMVLSPIIRAKIDPGKITKKMFTIEKTIL